MARLLALPTLASAPPPAAALLLSCVRRRLSDISKGTQLASLDPQAEIEIPRISRLEDAIYEMIIRLSAPDWLPFVPGSSYWVPPMKEIMSANPMTGEEIMSFTSVRGWPSLSYFVEEMQP